MTLTVHPVSLSCPAKAGHPVIPVPSVKLCCAQVAVPWLLDRPVEPGDDSRGFERRKHRTRPNPLRLRSHLRLRFAPEPARSLRKPSPPFITNFTRSSSVTSFAGLPETATISAYLPFSMDPTRSPQPMLSAATDVAERIACRGVIPYSTMVANSTASSP